MEDRDYETEARDQGWRPETEWEGDPPKSGFKTAQQFVEDGEKINPILRNKIDRLESRVEQLLDSNKKFGEFTQRSIDREKKEKAEVVKKLEEARKQAVSEGDGEAFAAADKQLKELDQPDIQPGDLDPVAKNWLQSNRWYEKDPVLGPYADGIADRLVAQGYTPGSQAYFGELTQRVKDAFPDKFENPNRKKSNGVETDGEKGSEVSGAKTWANLPADAKRECEQFMRDIPGFKKEDYIAQYDWE